MNDETKITLTIPALCAVLGTEFCNHQKRKYGMDNKGSFSTECSICKTVDKILSPNDLIPTDECENCRKCKHDHLQLPQHLSEDGNCIFCIYGHRTAWKPLLRKVKTIKLTERCECGHKLGDSTAYPKCKDYKPVQTVEIEVSR